MKIQIKNGWNQTVLFETDAKNLGDAVAQALKVGANLSTANLHGANLRKADLSGANLHGADLRSADLRSANLHGADLRKADLHGASLRGANLHGANLRKADLSGADLHGADLSGANLCNANLHGANLHGANLHGANLYNADLRSADLHCANLYNADLRNADLHGANLRKADLSGADLYNADLYNADLLKKDRERIFSTRTILPDGELTGWKKLDNGVVCELRIPRDAARVGGVIGRKCRAEFAFVVSGEGKSIHDGSFSYVVGKKVKPESFDPNFLKECAPGIHFFITRQEAEDYN